MTVNFDKYIDGLAPVIVQDSNTSKVLMLGFMNKEALDTTLDKKIVVFFSRSKQRLWMKGETSGNFLNLVDILIDCDGDTLLIKASPTGPVCHTGADTCFAEQNVPSSFIYQLEGIIKQRRNGSDESSYTHQLFKQGINRIAQKVGEEAFEAVIASKDENKNAFLNEAADLLFHYIILLQAKGTNLAEIESVLRERNSQKKN